jgi:hypothetical protein
MSTAPSPYAYTDPRAGEILDRVLCHQPEDLEQVMKRLADLYTPTEAVIWLTRPHEALGWKWPLWCRRAEVEALLAPLTEGVYS